MNIIIVGAGKVGFNLAKELLYHHNITMIDSNADALSLIKESLDVLTIQGNASNIQTYQKLYEKKVELFIAVTNSDNTNIVATLVASSILEIDSKIIRLQKLFYKNNNLSDLLHINSLVFPLELSSLGVRNLIKYPKANNIKSFEYTSNKLISIRIEQELAFKEESQNRYTIVGYERDKRFFIFHKEDKILAGDLVYFFGDEVKIRTLCKELNSDKEVENCVIYGANELGVLIAKALLSEHKNVKIIDKDRGLCQKADEELNGEAIVINNKYSSSELFKSEEIFNADIFISATDDDEFNIIKSLEAKEKGIKKVVAINNELEYYNLMHSLGIVVVRGPKISATTHILEQINSSNILIQKSFCGGKAIVFLRKIAQEEKKIKIPSHLDCAFYRIQNEKIYPLQKSIIAKRDDILVIFCPKEQEESIRKYLYGL